MPQPLSGFDRLRCEQSRERFGRKAGVDAGSSGGVDHGALIGSVGPGTNHLVSSDEHAVSSRARQEDEVFACGFIHVFSSLVLWEKDWGKSPTMHLLPPT